MRGKGNSRAMWQRIRILSFVLLLLGYGCVEPASSMAASSPATDQGLEDFRGSYDSVGFGYAVQRLRYDQEAHELWMSVSFSRTVIQTQKTVAMILPAHNEKNGHHTVFAGTACVCGNMFPYHSLLYVASEIWTTWRVSL